jgi:putative peptidoglycan lipid II flippase
MVVLAEPIIAVLYQRGLFTYAETMQTAAGLRWMALGICSVAFVRQTVPVFYAIEQVWVPVIGTPVFILGYLVFALPLMGSFKHEGLCMALSIGATFQGLFLVAVLRARIGRLDMARTLSSWMRMLLASIPMAAAAWAISLLGVWTKGGNSFRNIGVLLLTLLSGVVIYVLAAYVFKVAELRDLLSALKRRRHRGPDAAHR